MRASSGIGANVASLNSYGEDLLSAAHRARELSARYCGGCRDYHALFLIERLFGSVGKIPDREQLADLAGEVARKNKDFRRVLIAGSADTGILSTIVCGLRRHAPNVVDEVEFIVADACQTPLELCRDYAKNNGIHLTLSLCDLTSDQVAFNADLIVQHGLLSFLSPNEHAATLQRFVKWLAPDGKLIVSCAVRESVDGEGQQLRRVERAKEIRNAVESGLLNFLGDTKELLARVDKKAERKKNEQRFSFASFDEFEGLLNRLCVPTISFDRLSIEHELSNGQTVRRRRALAVLGSPTP